MPARLVQPQTVKGGDERPLDLEAELKRAASQTSEGALDFDALEELSCIATEAAEGDPDEDTFRSAVEPLLESMDDARRDAVFQALWSVAKTSSSTMAIAVPRMPARSAPIQEEGAPRWRTRSAVDLMRAKEYLQGRALSLQQEHIEDAKREIALQEFYRGGSVAVEEDEAAPSSIGPTKPPDASDSEDSSEGEDDITISEREIIKRRLRELGHPATFFGEDDDARFQRLKELELGTDQNELATGSTNVMQLIERRMAREKTVEKDEEEILESRKLAASKKQLDFSIAKKAKITPVLALKDNMTPFGGTYGVPASVVLEQMEDDDEGADMDTDDSDTRTVVKWLRNTLRDWEIAITRRTPEEHASSMFKGEKAHFRQSKQYLRPLRKSLQTGKVNPEIVRHLAIIANHSDKRQYREAKQAYMTLAIGNQAWPMGVNMVTFHDRPNRHNISEEASAHVLDDETTRKYVQMVKRLLTFVESHVPRDGAFHQA